MTLKRVRMELARNKDFPEGSPNHGYEATIPLTATHAFDPEAWEADALVCTAVKFATGTDDEHGQLVRTEAGPWAFSYELGETDDEPIHRLEAHVFEPDEYVTVTDIGGEEHVYRIKTVEDLHFPTV